MGLLGPKSDYLVCTTAHVQYCGQLSQHNRSALAVYFICMVIILIIAFLLHPSSEGDIHRA